MDIIVKTDLPENIQNAELIDVLLAGANAKAGRVAPCLTTDDPRPSIEQINEAKMVLLGAVKRWADAGAGALQSQQAGPFGVQLDTRQRTGYNLWPSEITDLQDICKSASSDDGAYAIDTAPMLDGAHAPWCALAFGATYCSCGTDIAGEPIYEQP